MKIIMNKECL